MKKKNTYRNSEVYRYLKCNGFLDKSAEEIANAKKQYWKQYKRNWRKAKRGRNKSITLLFDKQEYAELKVKAIEHKRSVTKYIKEAAIAYSRNQYVVMDIRQVMEIKELLTLNYNFLQKRFNEMRLPFKEGLETIERYRRLENKVLQVMFHPQKVADDY